MSENIGSFILIFDYLLFACQSSIDITPKIKQPSRSVKFSLIFCTYNINYNDSHNIFTPQNNNYTMGYYYNAQCTDQTCSAQCCNQAGTCPNYSSASPSQNQCWYYYIYNDGQPPCSSLTGTSNKCCYSSSTGFYACDRAASLVGGIVGGVVGLFVFLMIMICVIRRCRGQRQQQDIQVVPANSTTIVGSTPNVNYGQPPINYGNAYGAPIVNYNVNTGVNFPYGVYPSNTNGMVPVQPYSSQDVSKMK